MAKTGQKDGGEAGEKKSAPHEGYPIPKSARSYDPRSLECCVASF
jgi:hypothetical protein